MTIGPPSDLPVQIEVVLVGVVGGALRWWRTSARLTAPTTPDGLARRLAGVGIPAPPAGRPAPPAGRPAPPPAGTALHSTSWRYAGGVVVLTYALFPAARPRPDWSPLAEHVAVCAGPVHPSPPLVDGNEVAAHAVRHLADLAGGRDPHLTACAARMPASWGVLLAHGAHVHAHPPAACSPHEATG